MVGILYFCIIGVLQEKNGSVSDWENNLENITEIWDSDTYLKYVNSSFFNTNETLVLNNINLPANIDDLPNSDDAQNQTSDFELNHDVWPKNSDKIREQHENDYGIQKNAEYSVNDTDLHKNNNDYTTQSQKRKNTPLPKFCEECNVPFKFVKEYEKHAREHHSGKKIFHCTTDGCNRSFTSQNSFYKHREIAHNVEKKKRMNAEDLLCRFCRENFDNYHALIAHFKKSHPGEKKYKCEHCPKAFDMRCRKVKHEREVHLNQSITCTVCRKSFKREWYYQKHIQKCRVNLKLEQVSKKERKYKCDRCGKLLDRIKYSNHMWRHKMYPPCPICGMGFAKQKGMDRLVNHIRWRHPQEFPKINIEEVIENKGKICSWRNGKHKGDEFEIYYDNKEHETLKNVDSLEDARELLPEHDEDQPIANRQINDKCFLGQNGDHLLENAESFKENVVDPLGKNDGLSTNSGYIPTLNTVGNIENVQELQEHDADQPISDRQMTNNEIDDHLMGSINDFMENVIDPLENNDNPSSNDQNIWADFLENLRNSSYDGSLWWRKWCDHWATYSCEESSRVSSKPKPFCAECHEPFENIWDYVNHVGQSHANKKLFRCNVPGCGKRFTALSTLYDHRTENHLTGKNRGVVGENAFNCRICGGKFQHFCQLERHFTKIHPGEKKYKCKYCTETFDKMEPKQQHELKEHEDRYFECDACKRTFTKAWYLNKHAPKCWGRQSREIAEHEWIQECHLCRKKFIFPRDQGRYANHMRRYKKYPHCPVCGIILKEKNSDSSNIPILVNHIRWRHPDEFPKINIKAVLENKEMTSVWKIEENANEENDADLATVS